MKIKAEYVPAIVTAAAFTASAAHIVTVVNETNPMIVALAYPIGIDGLIYVGIGAMQKGRKAAGILALLVGSVYSLLFNADAENALTMTPLAIAASMPICLFASFIIEYTGRKPVEPEVRIEYRDRIVEKRIEVPAVTAATPASRMRWIGAGARPTLPIVPRFAPAPVIVATVPRTKVETAKPKAITVRPADGTDSAPGRKIGWDVAEAVGLMDEGRTNEEVGTKVGVATKQIQRARRVLVFVRTTDRTDVEIHEVIKGALSLPVIAAIRQAATR